ncbi:peptidoglycan-binding protein [Bosea sp. (in: a-proteobacteria)]|uniref:peptidoglycan-binding protein n=1 Tax=Bosea sp. (in: a-proteobacteria) TaxID=1871050 RepID=UPI00261057DA|nr:peptidoglycan-binding protein [Bosea sp. (in: a-proteobacteria)]MCO5089674.1 serine protease [Bosea sp. (in: a-proteobacteria)]
MPRAPLYHPRTALLCATALVLALIAAPPAGAQAPAANPQMAAAQTSFEALPEAERKAIQDDLIWAGQFNGAVSGAYGPLTFRAINAFKGRRGAPDGVLAPAERAALARAAQAARDAAGFQLLADDRTGVRIGIPTKLLPKRGATPAGGSRWQSADEKVTLDTSASPPGEDLAALFEKAIAVNPNSPRKITYKLLRPDFFVVTGETPGGRFYRRLSTGPQGLRGFSIGYDKALAPSVDKLVIAIAASFEPFPGAAAPPAVAGPAPAARGNERHGVALALDERTALAASASLDGCRSLRVGDRVAKLRLKDDASGLALVDLEGVGAAKPPGLRAEAPAAGEALVLVAYGADAGGRVALALPGEGAPAGAKPGLRAPLQPGQAGAPAFDRQGRLVGIVTESPSDKLLIAGVAPQRGYGLADAAAIRALTGKAGVSLPPAAGGPELSTGAVVERVSGAVRPVLCGL